MNVNKYTEEESLSLLVALSKKPISKSFPCSFYPHLSLLFPHPPPSPSLHFPSPNGTDVRGAVEQDEGEKGK